VDHVFIVKFALYFNHPNLKSTIDVSLIVKCK